LKRYAEAQNIQLVFSGNNYFELLEDIIDRSKEVIHLQTYIFETDSTGTRIASALKKAAERNVKVYVLVDAFGSNSFSKQLVKDLRNGGVHFRKFSPLFSSESIYYGRRLHYKVVVADKHIALTGGINIADKYNENTKSDPWLDYAVLTEGRPCEFLHILCEKAYNKQNDKELISWEKDLPTAAGSGNKLIRFRVNDFIKRKNEIHQDYNEQLRNADKCVTIVASYFLPGHGFRRLLTAASKRGVVIRIILAGESDVWSVRFAESYLYDFLLRNKIQLYEWSNSVLHGKAMLVDDRWATVGSYNLNFLSHYISIELNADIMDPEFIKTFNTHLDHIIGSACKNVDLKTHVRKSNYLRRAISWLAYGFFRILMNLTVNKKTKRNKWIH
jgi:cardiolipin synthase A/B